MKKEEPGRLEQDLHSAQFRVVELQARRTFLCFFKACVCGGGFVQGSSRIILRTFYEPGQRDIWRASSLRPRAGQGAILKPLQSGHMLTL